MAEDGVKVRRTFELKDGVKVVRTTTTQVRDGVEVERTTTTQGVPFVVITTLADRPVTSGELPR